MNFVAGPSAGVIVAIVAAILLVGIVILGIFIYLRIYHGRILEGFKRHQILIRKYFSCLAASEKGATGAPPIYAEPSSPEKNVPMQSLLFMK